MCLGGRRVEEEKDGDDGNGSDEEEDGDAGLSVLCTALLRSAGVAVFD